MSNKKLTSIKKACELADSIFEKLIKKLKQKEFTTEKQIANFINREIWKADAKKSFPTIVASGTNAVNWHHKPTTKKLRKGFCVIDFGVKVNEYCGDMTRTIYFGKASKTEKRIYSIVKKTNEKAIKKIKAKINAKELYLFAKKSLGAYALYFGHGLGHGLGKKVHSNPRISKKDAILKKGDIITIEPGVYIPRVLGIRIEDDILVKARGYRVLSKSSKKLIELH